MNSFYCHMQLAFRVVTRILVKGVGVGWGDYALLFIYLYQFKKQLILNDDHAVIVNSGST